MSLRVENLRIYYRTLRGYVKAVDGVSFEMGDEEVLGVAGESGCGKSTLGNSLILLKPPMTYMEGRVFLDGEEVPIWDNEKMRRFRYRRISIIPQYAMNALNPTKKLKVLMDDLLREHGSDFKSHTAEILRRLKMVNLPESVLNMYPIELSGGMKQRMVMVISTLMNPSLLIADEITSALDVSTQKAVIEMLLEFKSRGFVRKIFFITHDISVLYQIASSILVMYAGKLVEKASTDEILEKPFHPYTEMLISSLPKIGIKYGERKLKGIPGQPPPLLKPPEGCRFKDRCPYRHSKCDEEPPIVEISDDHVVSCWKYA
ncbi:MAG: ABC transporter ATP-binding protein [Thermotoga sp.]|nr:MAG: ABC transporter ATP-binding protein [Thermotoga sp.]